MGLGSHHGGGVNKTLTRGMKVTSGISMMPFVKMGMGEQSRSEGKLRVLISACNVDSLLQYTIHVIYMW